VGEPNEAMDFQVLGEWDSPMESEIYPAALREREIPHRTRRGAAGRLIIEVPADWLAEARQVVADAARVFFGDTPERPGAPVAVGAAPPGSGQEVEDDDEDDEDEEDEDPAAGAGDLFRSADALPSVESLRLRKVWVARALAALPGLGLGHWYAGQGKAALLLFLSTTFSVGLAIYTGSWWAGLLGAGAWAVDLALAPGYVKDENQRALHARHKVAEKEQEFLASLGDQGGRR